MSGASTNPGIYPGNPSLPREVRDKILATFKHTLSLYQEGKLDDCLIGCDFILKMDPRFSPARRLLEKAKNPAADVDLIELEAIVATTPARRQRPSTADAEKLLVRAVESYNARDFDACINAAEQVLTALPGNVHATDLIEKARRKKEVAADFEASRARALSLLESGQAGEAEAELNRMRNFDPEHPAVSLLERRLQSAGGAGLEAPTREPEISFGESAPNASGGLDSLSLDGLTLDGGPSSEVVPPPALAGARRGPLAPDAPSGSDPGSPGDLWTEGAAPEGAAPPPPPPPPARPAPVRAAPPEDPAKAERDIALLLKQGDDAAARGDHQAAIEIWSRIFLIDINSVEAVTRIEKARQDMAEGNERLTQMLAEGKEAFDAGDFASARAEFLQVLAIDASEPTARSYLDQIEKQLASPRSAAGPSASAGGEEKAAPEEAAQKQPPPKKKSAGPGVRVNPRVAAIGGAFVVLVAIGYWFLFHQPRPAAPPPAPPRVAGSLEKATALFQEGKIPETVAELKRIRPSDPDYAKARQLLDSLVKTQTEPAAAPGAPAPAAAPAGGNAVSEASDPAPIRARAERALAEKRYIDALKDFSTVAPAFQGDPAFSQSLSAASEKVAELTPAVKLYNEGEYDTAVPVLWRIYQADKGNQDARSYLLRCYANQGITQLQNGLYQKAKQSFDEALALDPQDTEVFRHRKFAERYQKGDLDLMGRIYVRHLSHRP